VAARSGPQRPTAAETQYLASVYLGLPFGFPKLDGRPLALALVLPLASKGVAPDTCYQGSDLGSWRQQLDMVRRLGQPGVVRKKARQFGNLRLVLPLG
jgi:hypothetical protein